MSESDDIFIAPDAFCEDCQSFDCWCVENGDDGDDDDDGYYADDE